MFPKIKVSLQELLKIMTTLLFDLPASQYKMKLQNHSHLRHSLREAQHVERLHNMQDSLLFCCLTKCRDIGYWGNGYKLLPYAADIWYLLGDHPTFQGAFAWRQWFHMQVEPDNDEHDSSAGTEALVTKVSRSMLCIKTPSIKKNNASFHRSLISGGNRRPNMHPGLRTLLPTWGSD